MIYILTLLIGLTSFAQTTYMCEIDQLDEQYADDSYLIVEMSSNSKITSVMTMPLSTSHYDEMTRLDQCSKTDYGPVIFCKDSNKFNNTDPAYVQFDKRSKSILWFGSTFNENYNIIYNCKLVTL